ncbi:MAG TPA: DUF6541 family protein, partial [Candidatus Limnocylindria bacterium]|nr:DUF6541 family protein [Candidatus Limnocylindria bacterium]
LFGVTRATLADRVGRFALVGGVTAAASSYMWLPFLMYSPYINVTPYLERFKYDSYGAPAILTWLVSGDLLDHGRIPVLTVLLGIGAVAAVVTRARLALLSVGLFALWLVLYFGRPTLGGLIDLLPLSDGLFLHRLIGAVDIFAVLLIGIGGAWLWDLARASSTRTRLTAATAAALLLLAPALGERRATYAQGAEWMRRTQAALDADADARAVMDALRREPPGRVYAGHDNNWGRTLDFGIPFTSVRFYNLIAHHGLDAAAPPNQSLSLNADLLWDFDDQDLSHYRLFNVSYVVAPRGRAFPPELRALVTTAKYVLYAAPGRGYAEYAAIAGREAPATQRELFARELAWLRGGDPGRWSFTRFDYPHATEARAAVPTPACAGGEVAYQRVQPARFDVLARCATASAMVVKVTYHPNWRVTVDGTEVPTFMASPSLLAFALPAGDHFVVAEYRSTPLKAPLLILGGVVLGAAGAVSRRAWLLGSPGRVRALLVRLRPLQPQWSQRRARRD